MAARPPLFHETAHEIVLGVGSLKKRPGRAPAKKVGTPLQRHRAEMRRRGFKLVQLWVPDPTARAFQDAVRTTKAFLQKHPDREWDAFARRALDEAPGWVDE